MNAQQRGLSVASLSVVVVVLALAWWVHTVVTPPPIVTQPGPASSSPLRSPLLETLKQRTIYGTVPVPDPGDSGRADPFVRS